MTRESNTIIMPHRSASALSTHVNMKASLAHLRKEHLQKVLDAVVGIPEALGATWRMSR
jgi:hypothetical protein